MPAEGPCRTYETPFLNVKLVLDATGASCHCVFTLALYTLMRQSSLDHDRVREVGVALTATVKSQYIPNGPADHHGKEWLVNVFCVSVNAHVGCYCIRDTLLASPDLAIRRTTVAAWAGGVYILSSALLSRCSHSLRLRFPFVTHSQKLRSLTRTTFFSRIPPTLASKPLQELSLGLGTSRRPSIRMHQSAVIAALAAALSTVPLVSAHGYVSGVVAGGKYFAGTSPNWNSGEKTDTCGWYAENQDNGFVKPSEFSTPDIICHKNAEVGGAPFEAAAGDELEFQWNTWPDSHKGPVITYIASVSSEFKGIKKESLKWAKIAAEGLKDGSSPPGKWATDDMLGTNVRPSWHRRLTNSA